MNTRISVVLAVLAVLVLAGCASEQQGNPLTDPFIGGNLGVNLYLQDGAPPPTVYDGGKFPFGVNVVVENVGEADIGPGTDNPYMTAKLEGINPSTFGVTAADLHQTLQEPVRGATKNFDGTIIGGMLTNFVFEGLNYQGRLQGNDILTLRASVCYDYENIATSQLCFKDDIIENVEDSTICTLVGERPFHNSGGPIHVSGIIQNPLGENRIQANFVLDHVGPGEFYGRKQGEDCDPSFRNSNKYKVDVTVEVEDPSASVHCFRLGNSNQGTVTLYAGSPQTITCTVEGGSEGTRVYTDILTITTKYRYGQFIEQPIIIQAVPQEISD